MYSTYRIRRSSMSRQGKQPLLRLVRGAIRVEADCDTLSGPTPKDEARVLYSGHPGCHTWQYTDPEHEAIERSPEFQRALSDVPRVVIQRTPEEGARWMPVPRQHRAAPI